MGSREGTKMPAGADIDLSSKDIWRAVSAEFVATLLFVYVAVGTVIGGGSVVANAMAFGLTISVLVHACGHISGGHINPAVTLALVVTKRVHWKRAVLYVAAQILGGIFGALICWSAMPDTLTPGSTSGLEYGAGCNSFDDDHLGAGKALWIEVLGTFVLVFTVFATVDTTRASTDLGPFQIGLAVLVAHLVGIPQTGTGINPARSFGPSLAFAMLGDNDKWKAAHTNSDGPFDGHWVYWLGPIIGSVCAALLYDMWFGNEQNSNMRDAFKKVTPAVSAAQHESAVQHTEDQPDEQPVPTAVQDFDQSN